MSKTQSGVKHCSRTANIGQTIWYYTIIPQYIIYYREHRPYVRLWWSDLEVRIPAVGSRFSARKALIWMKSATLAKGTTAPLTIMLKVRDLLAKNEKAKRHTFVSIAHLEVRLPFPAFVAVFDFESRTFRAWEKSSEQPTANTVGGLPDNSQTAKLFHVTQTLKSPKSGSHWKLHCPAGEPKSVKRECHVDETRIRLVMGPTKFPWITFLAKHKNWRYTVEYCRVEKASHSTNKSKLKCGPLGEVEGCTDVVLPYLASFIPHVVWNINESHYPDSAIIMFG